MTAPLHAQPLPGVPSGTAAAFYTVSGATTHIRVPPLTCHTDMPVDVLFCQNGHFQLLRSSAPQPNHQKACCEPLRAIQAFTPTNPVGKDNYDITVLWWQGTREQLDVGVSRGRLRGDERWPSSNTPLSWGSLSNSSSVLALEALSSPLLLVPILLEIRAQRDESVPGVDRAPQPRAGRSVSAEHGSERPCRGL